MAGNIIELTQDNFESEVIESTIPVLVDFWAEWCGPCRALAPVIDQLAAANGDKIKVGKVNIDKSQSIATDYGISAIPTVIIFKNGEPAKKSVGLTTLQELQKALDELL